MKSLRRGKRQCGVIPVRFSPSGVLEVLLITSRGTGRWVIPKGWPMKGRTAAEAAVIEAFEEAGLQGHAGERLGAYRYLKVGTARGKDRSLTVDVFLMWVDQLLDEWPEQGERERAWFTPGEAAARVSEHGLARMLKRLHRSVVWEGGLAGQNGGAEVRMRDRATLTSKA